MISNELSKKLCEALFKNKGLEVNSIYGKGTEFSFILIDVIDNQSNNCVSNNLNQSQSQGKAKN